MNYYNINGEYYSLKQYNDDDIRAIMSEFFFDTENLPANIEKITEFANHGFYPVFSYYGTGDSLNYSSTWFAFFGVDYFGKPISIRICYNEKTNTFTLYKSMRKIGVFEDIEVVEDMLSLKNYAPAELFSGSPIVSYKCLKKTFPFFSFTPTCKPLSTPGNKNPKGINICDILFSGEYNNVEILEKTLTNGKKACDIALSKIKYPDGSQIVFRSNDMGIIDSIEYKKTNSTYFGNITIMKPFANGGFDTDIRPICVDTANNLNFDYFMELLTKLREYSETSLGGKYESVDKDKAKYFNNLFKKVYTEYIGNDEWMEQVEKAVRLNKQECMEINYGFGDRVQDDNRLAWALEKEGKNNKENGGA